ncbi:MAG: phage tail tape measure protein family, partial [Bacilli bacterium]|nr:phage tail tape measure protein family [Bacilli bacterium]
MADDIEVGTLRAKIETDDTGIKGTLDGLTRQLKVVQSEFAATSAKLGAFATSEDVAKAKADSLTQQMEIQQQ